MNGMNDLLAINVSSLYSSIDRMSNNSGRVKTLFLPFVGIILSMEFTIAFASNNCWFSIFEHQLIFGGLIAAALFLCSLIFMMLDTYYLKYGRRYRKIYQDYCLPPNGAGRIELLDIATLQKVVRINKKPSGNTLLFYFLVDLVVILLYFITSIIIFHVYLGK